MNNIQERRTWWQTVKSCSGTAADRRNQYWFVFWCFAWALLIAASSRTLKSDFEFSMPVAWAIALTPSIFGVGAVLAYMKFLRMADELIQKIQMEGLAFGFGFGLIFGLGYQLLEKAGAPEMTMDDMALVLMGGWMLGQILATGRYR